LEEIQSATELVDHLEKIEAPSQIASALRDPLLQKYLQLGGSEDAIQRLEFWLDCYFEEELETIREGFGISASLSELLSGVTSYVEMSKVVVQVSLFEWRLTDSQIVPPIVEQFLFVYLPLWNGSSDLGYILDLMSYIPPQPFSELQNKLLNTLERSILNGAEAPFNVLFGFYSTLVQRWMSPASSNRGRASRNISVANEVHDLVQHVALLAESAVAAGQSTQASIISFYERVTDLVTEQIEARKQIMPAILPPRTLTYSLATSTTFSDFSRLCALLVTYKRCFERQGIAVAMNHESNPTDILNGYLMDVCNLIWRSRALNTTDSNAAGLLCSEPVTTRLQAYLSMVERDYSVHTAFDFSHGSLTAALAQTALSNLEGTLLGSNEDLPLHAGPVTQRSLTVLEKEGGIKLSWKHYRVEMLTWLEAHGLDGLKRLMFATMKDLMK
jgi:centromere protein I